MSYAQIMLVVLAVIILLSSFVDVESVKKYFTKIENRVKNKTDGVLVKPQIIPDSCCEGSIACVVEKWEELKKCCDNSNLKQASTKLDDVFPLLAAKEEKNV